MKYYLHDSSAFDDEKITELYMKFGYEGLGLFYTLLEKMAKQEKPVKTTVLKQQLHIGKKLEKCWNFMEEIGLISSNNGETFNKQLLNFSKKYQIKKEKNAKRVSEWREKQELTENVTHYESVRNARKVKESKDNNNDKNHYQKEVRDLNISFDEFWEHYDKKTGDKKKLIAKWQALKDDERVLAMEHIKKYKIAQPDKSFRKDPQTYLNNKSFNDEIIYRNSGVKNEQQPNERLYTKQEQEQRAKLFAAGFKPSTA